MDENEIRAEKILKQYGFDFCNVSRPEIIGLLNEEISNYQEGSSEYLRILCGYIFCIGNIADIELINNAKYSINFDVRCMIDGDWIDSVNWRDSTDRSRLVDEFISYYRHYFDLDN